MRRPSTIAFTLAAAALNATAGSVEDRAGGTVIHVKVYELPDPARTDTITLAETAVVKEFLHRWPRIFAERYRAKYKAQPEKYGRHNWDEASIELSQFAGLSIDSGSGGGREWGRRAGEHATLMAIAGGVAPDVLYLIFRHTDTYIQQRFLYPLDKPEDGYFAALPPDEVARRVHPKVWPVIRREGPGGDTHVWSMPYGGVLGKVVLYRKDLLDAAGVAYPHNNWTWNDLYEACRKVTDPDRGIYGIQFRPGMNESYYWFTFLWSAGGEALRFDPLTRHWRAAWGSPEAARALEFYNRLCTEPWTDRRGRKRFGYALKDVDMERLWDMGRVAFRIEYVTQFSFFYTEYLLNTVNPEITGMAPVPLGPGGTRASEFNSRMFGLFAGIQHPAVRDAAWEYIRFHDSREAAGIRTRIMVEGGLGRFIHPQWLREFGYDDLVRLTPRGWEECFRIAVETGKPEPHTGNTQRIYAVLSQPLQKAGQLALEGKLPETAGQRRALFEKMLRESAARADERMIGILPAEERRKRRAAAAAVLALLCAGFAAGFRRIWRVFAPAAKPGSSPAWRFHKYRWAYLALLPAVVLIAVWQYLPLAAGSAIAFQDFRIMGGSQWVWLDNFGDLLWDEEWWSAVYNSLRYTLLTTALTFFPPLMLAVLLQELPRGRLLFRTLFYLPAVVTGLVVVYLWRTFYEPSESGALNAVLMKIPAAAYIALGLALFGVAAAFARRLLIVRSYRGAALLLLLGAGLFLICLRAVLPALAQPGAPWHQALWLGPQEPYRWLEDSRTAMLACVLPLAWAGLGPGCLIYLAALKGISDEFYEAADIDGATFRDKLLFVVIPMLRPLLIIQFVGIFIAAWSNSAYVLAMTGGASGTTVAGLYIFYSAYLHLKFGPAAAMAWMLGFMLIGFTVHQLRLLSRVEFRAAGNSGD